MLFNDVVYCAVYFGLLTYSESNAWVTQYLIMGTNVRYEGKGVGLDLG